MAPPKKDRRCSIEGCGRRHAANGFCLMHYKRVARHGNPEYRWGGKVVGRPCTFCARPAAAREMCERHYQMWLRHGDALYADNKKVNGMPNGTHMRRGRYIMECPVADIPKAAPATNPAIEKTDRPHAVIRVNQGLRDGSKRSRREWRHRKIAGAKKGDVVHHIDLDPGNNDLLNLHVFHSPSEHAQAHRSLERAAAQLLAQGFLEFDRIEGVYRLAEFSRPTCE